MKSKIYYAYAFFFLILTTLLIGCKAKKESVGKDHVLVMVTSADNPPFESHRIVDGKNEIIGFDIDLAHLIAKSLNVELEIKDMDFNNLIPALQAHRADFSMAAIMPTEERRKNISFSVMYYNAASAVVTLKGKKIIEEKDFQNQKIGVQLGSAYEHMIKNMAIRIPSLTVISLNKLGDLVQQVLTGRLDGLVTEKIAAEKYTSVNPSLGYEVLEGQQPEYSIVFPKESPWIQKFDDALAKLKAKGEIDKLAQKWFKN